MITRKSLIALAVFVLVCFVVAGAIGQHHHGVVMAIGDVAWFGLIFGLLFLIVGSATAIVRNRRQPDHG